MKQQHQMYQKLLNEKEELERIEADYKKQTSELRMQNIELGENNDRLERATQDMKSKVSLMQQELTTNETVQKDFVKLSQSLQVGFNFFKFDFECCNSLLNFSDAIRKDSVC